MIKRILVATSLLCMCCILFAQNVQVKGKVVSENEAVEFANVVLQDKGFYIYSRRSNRQ